MCAICESEHRQAIEADVAGGVPERKIAQRFNVNRNALQRHRNRCLKGSAVAPVGVKRAANLRARLRRLEGLQRKAERAGKFAESVRCFELADSIEREIATLQALPKPQDVDRKQLAPEYVAAVREALGFKPPRAEQTTGIVVVFDDPLHPGQTLRMVPEEAVGWAADHYGWQATIRLGLDRMPRGRGRAERTSDNSPRKIW